MSDPSQAGRTPDPFDAVFNVQQNAQSSSNDPFASVFGSPQQPTGGEVVQQPLAIGDQIQQAARPSERAALESQALAYNRQQIESILQRPDLTPGHRKRLEMLLQRWAPGESVAGIELTNRETDPNRPTAENLGRGLAAGAVNYGGLGALDLVAGGLQTLASGAQSLGAPIAPPRFIANKMHLPQFRQWIADAQQLVREDFDAQGWWGLGGTAVGGLVGGLKPYQILNSAGMRTLARISPAAAAWVVRGIAPGATYLERLAANAIGSGAVDAVQAADILTEPDVPWQQRAIALLATTGISLGAAGIASIRPIKPVDAARPATTEAGGVTTEGQTTRAAEAGEMVKKAARQQANVEQRLELNRQGKAEWEKQNPGKSWKDDLSKNEKKQWLDDYRARHKPPSVEQAPEAVKEGEASGEQAKAPSVEPGSESGPSTPPVSDTNLDTSKRPSDLGLNEPAKVWYDNVDPVDAVEMFGFPKKPWKELTPDEQDVVRNMMNDMLDEDVLDPTLDELGQRQLSPESQRKNGEMTLDVNLSSIEKQGKPFQIDDAKRIWEGLKPESRDLIFGASSDWAKLHPNDRARVYADMKKRFIEIVAQRAEANVNAQLNRNQRIDLGEKLIAEGTATGDVYKIHRGEEALARQEALPDNVNADAVLTRMVDDLIQDIDPKMKTDIMLSIFRGEMPHNRLFAGDKAIAYLLRTGANYDPKYSVPRRPATKPESAPSPPASPRADTQEPAPHSPRAEGASSDEQLSPEQLRQELARVKVERDEARRQADTDALTGYGNKDAFLRAQKTADEDPNTEVTFFDVTNFKPFNDIDGAAADRELVRFGRAIETAMLSMGLVSDEPNATVRIFRQGDEFFVLHPRGRGRELIATAKKIAGIEHTQVGGESYVRQLRGATAKTFDEVNLKIAEVKKKEPFKKARPAGKQEFHGEQIKRPVEQMGANELESLQDKFDKLHDDGKISDAEYELVIRELGAADKVRVAREKPYADRWDSMKPEDRAVLIGENHSKKPWISLSDSAREKFIQRSGGEDVPPAARTETESAVQEAQAEMLEELPPDPSAPARVVGKSKLSDKIPEDPAILLARAEKRKRMFRTPIEKLSDADLIAHRDDVQMRVNEMGKAEAKESGYAERLAKLNEEIARRSKSGDSGTAYAHPAVTGALGGFFTGLFTPADNEQERARNVMYFTLAGLSIGAGAKYLLRAKQAADAALPEYHRNIRKTVKSVEDAPLDRRTGLFTHLMRAYGAIARRDIGISNVSKLAGTKNLPAGKSAGKRAELFGLWRGMTDRWLFGDQVGYWNNDGQFVPLDAKTMAQISAMVNGDLRTVGDLAAAHRELVLRGLEHPRTTGLNITDARNMYVNTPEQYHLASQELSKFFRAMRDMSVAAGLISKESAQKMDEQGFYVAVRRLFGGEPGTASSTISTKSSGKSKSTGPEDLFKRLRGSKLPFQNPVEAAIDLLPRYMRSAELNRLATTFFDEVVKMKPADRKLIARRLEGPEIPKLTPEAQAQVKKLQAAVRDEGGAHLSDAEAEAIVASLSDESLNVTNDKIRFFRDGKLEVWQVSDPIARAFKAFQPHELAMMLEGMGILTKPTNIARVGITANPVFVGWQAFRDIWQYHINGAHAPSPDANLAQKTIGAATSLPTSLYYSMRGWLEIMFRTGEYKRYVSAGAGGESVASQGLRIARGDIKKSADVLGRIREAPTRTQFGQIAREIRQGSLREAYASMLQPIADAGRFGAYLHERGRGADVIEAIFRAKKAGANFTNRGDSTALQALNRMTLFLNPAIQSMDASRYAFMRDKFGYIARGIAGITIPSMLLWAAYRDDEEINQLRSTEYGNKFWWFRTNGQIMKVPKPIFDGQVFGTIAEQWLDKQYREDPLATRKWVESMANDAAVNLLPFIGVVPVALMTNKIIGLDGTITPRGTEGLDPQYQARPNTTTIARLASQATAPLARALDTKFTDRLLSPAGFDFVVQQYLGGLGSELSRALSTAVDAVGGADLPPKEELPFVRSVFGNYPSMGVQAINEFYTFAERSDRAAQTANYLAQTHPEQLADYMTERLPDISTAKLYAETRKELADARKAIEDIRQAPRDVMSDAEKRELTQILMRHMIEITRNANEAAALIRNATATAAAP